MEHAGRAFRRQLAAVEAMRQRLRRGNRPVLFGQLLRNRARLLLEPVSVRFQLRPQRLLHLHQQAARATIADAPQRAARHRVLKPQCANRHRRDRPPLAAGGRTRGSDSPATLGMRPLRRQSNARGTGPPSLAAPQRPLLASSHGGAAPHPPAGSAAASRRSYAAAPPRSESSAAQAAHGTTPKRRMAIFDIAAHRRATRPVRLVAWRVLHTRGCALQARLHAVRTR